MMSLSKRPSKVGFRHGSYWKMFSVFLWWLLIWSCFLTPVTQGRYRCMLRDFIRLGNSCYLLSTEIASWQEAHFRCRDRGSQLAVLASQYEDSTLRSYLERPEFAQLGRWIGGMWAGKWIWAAQGTEIDNENSFVNDDIFSLDDSDQWMCLFMDPGSKYHWNSDNCMRQFHYICEAPLARETNTSANDASAAGGSIETSSATSVSYQTSTTEASNHDSPNGQTDPYIIGDIVASETISFDAHADSGHNGNTDNGNTDNGNTDNGGDADEQATVTSSQEE